MGVVFRLRGRTAQALAQCLVEKHGAAPVLRLAEHLARAAEQSGDRDAVVFWSALVEAIKARVN
jgi:hypothetical protein